MSTFDDRDFLRNVLLLDAATCAATGAFMIAGAAFLAPVTRIPETVLWIAGLSLLPVAAFITGVVARGSPPIGVWIVIAGNAVWAIASLLLLAGLSVNAFGIAFILVQAIAVTVLAEFEFIGLRRSAAQA
jgi:hypothetical protein